MSKIDGELLRDISQLEKDEFTGKITPEKRKQIIQRARREITDLKIAVTENLFFDAPAAKKEAEALFDGFNAVANGMEDPGAFARMEEIGQESIFYPWKNLIYALRSFYGKNPEAMTSFLEKIENESAPAVLKPILKKAAGRTEELSPDETEVFGAIIRKREQSDSDIEKIQECRNAGYFEMLPSLMADYAEKNADRGPDFTMATALRCFDILQEEAPLSYSAIKKFFSVIGEFDSFRLAAVSSLKFHTEQALFYWIEAVNALLEYAGAKDWEKVESLLGIIEEVWQCVNKEYRLTDDYRSLLLDKVTELKQKSASLFGEICPFYFALTENNTLEEVMTFFSPGQSTDNVCDPQTVIRESEEQVLINDDSGSSECLPEKSGGERDYKQLEFAF